MSKTLHLTDDLQLPLEIITMRTATYGDSGGGKTTFARLLAEKVHDAHHRFCAIDLKNDGSVYLTHRSAIRGFNGLEGAISSANP